MSDQENRQFGRNQDRNQDKVEQLKIPPHSIEAEQSVLGSMMIAPDSWDKVAEIVVDTDFYNRSHRIIFAAILKLLNNNQVVDAVTVKDTLAHNGQLEEAGGLSYLIELAKNTPSAANVGAYANVIRERAIVRELIGVAHDIADVGYNPEGRDSTDILDLAESKVFEIAEKRTGSNDGPIDVTKVLTKTVSRLDELVKQGSEITGVSTGYTDLDKKTSGLQRSDLIIVAARPSMGKCVRANTRMADPRSGRIFSIEEMVQQRNANVLSIDTHFKIHHAQASEFVDDGEKPTFKVTTALGRSIETTLTHPFLTGRGWQALENIEVGEKIAVPRVLSVFGNASLPSHLRRAIAYFVTDGGTTQSSPVFTNTNAAIVADFTQAMMGFDGLSVNAVAAKNRAPSYRVSAKSNKVEQARLVFSKALNKALTCLNLRGKYLAQQLCLQASTISQWRNAVTMPLPNIFERLGTCLDDEFIQDTRSTFLRHSQGHNPLTAWLRDTGVWGKHAHLKVLPDCIFSLPKAELADCLNRMFACDGGVYFSASGQIRASYATASPVLAQQIQHLLLRFGIIAKLRKKHHALRVQYEVEILHQESLLTLFKSIGILGKEDKVAQAIEALEQRRAHANQDSVPDTVIDYILQLKGDSSWQSLFLAAGIPCPDGYNPHLVGLSKRSLGRDKLTLFAKLFSDSYLHDLSVSEVYWDKIVDIQYTGINQVYDLSVPDVHNFIAQDICVHNTTFAMNLVENAMMLQDKPVLVFSLEMPAEQIMMRMLASLSRVNQTNIRTAQLNDEEWARISGTIKHLKEKDNLFIDDSSGLTPMELRTRARKLHRDRGGISMIMIDYLQLMRVPSLSENRTLEIAEISRSLKSLAKELEVPVVALSQLNRSLEQRADKRPINSDLRESGSIEQDADLIMFIYRDEVYHENSELKGIAEIIIGKQRNGPIGTTRLTFQGQFSRFDNYAGPEYDDEY